MNIKDIASLAETSVATVSRVINCDEHVAENTRKRVLEIIATTGYKPNLVGKALRAHRKGMILVLLPSISNPYYSRVLEGVEHRASAGNFDTLECITHRDYETEKRYLGLIKSGQVDGIILFTSTLGDNELDTFAASFPIVQCGANADNIAHISFACIDNLAASDEAVSYLVALGNEKIALINGPFGRPYEIDRRKGYERALNRAGIEVDERYIVGSDYYHPDAYDACKTLMALSDPPTAIFCGCDLMAAGAIKYLLELGIEPGKEVDIIGFDGTYLSDLTTPSVTCVEQPGYEMGKTAFDLLRERIEDRNSISKKVVMPHKLVIRNSTRPMPQ